MGVRSRLFWQYILAFGLVLVMPFSLLLITSAREISRQLEFSLIHEKQTSLSLTVDRLNEEMLSLGLLAHNTQQTLKTPVRHNRIDDIWSLREVLTSLKAGNQLFSDVYYVDMNDLLFYNTQSRFDSETTNGYLSSYDSSALFDKDNLQADWLELTLPGGEPVLGYRIPVFYEHKHHQARVRAVLLYVIQPSALVSYLSPIIGSEGNHIVLGSGERLLYSSSDLTAISKKMVQYELDELKELIQLEDDHFIVSANSAWSGNKLIEATLLIDNFYVSNLVQADLNRLILRSIGILIIGLFASWIVSNIIYKPIGTLDKYAQSLADTATEQAGHNEIIRTRDILGHLNQERMELRNQKVANSSANMLLKLFVDREWSQRSDLIPLENDEKLYFFLFHEQLLNETEPFMINSLPETGFTQGKMLVCQAPIQSYCIGLFRGKEEEYRRLVDVLDTADWQYEAEVESFGHLPIAYQDFLLGIQDPEQKIADDLFGNFDEIRRSLLYDDIDSYRRESKALGVAFTEAVDDYQIHFVYSSFITISADACSRKDVEMQPRFRRLMLKYATAVNSNRIHYQVNLRAFTNELITVLQDMSASPHSNLTQENMLQYLHKNVLLEQFSAKSMAIDFGVSVSHLSHAFKTAFGLTLSETVTQMRMSEAKRLLDETKNPVKTIGNAVGYIDASSFTRAFRAEMDMTPSQYRKLLSQR